LTGSIICGVDNSASARQAARVARLLAGRLGLGLVFVRAADGELSDAEMSATAERLEELSARVNNVDCGATWVVEAGRPADRLVDAAEKNDAALIVVGSPHSGGIAGDLWRRAPCPVVIVPLADDARLNGNGHWRRHVDEGRDFAGGIARLGLRNGDWREHVDEDRDFAGGIARLGLGGGGTDFDGGIARFGLGPREPGGL
jgi:nucleotide-binding universal stress UspA family protein